ncbi:MAG TPA: phosphate ABC transporter permease PstA [Candidatus Omnitrophota bacterium]|nr:phosphate ABC transporter permease PstA [Candidatus Omnitrophota bacterium]
MRRRKLKEKIFTALMVFSTVVVIGCLAAIILTILIKGAAALSLDMLIKTPEGGYYIGKGGGILNAILGSLALGIGATFISAAISLPVVFYLNLYRKKRSKLGMMIRFFLDVLWGIPSVVYGAFAFSVMVMLRLPASLLAGMFTVGLVIMPIMARSMDEALKMVPEELKEASLSMGATRLETALKVVFRQALPGIITAVLIAFGRGIGDAAAVLFTAGFTDSLPGSLLRPVATLPLAIFFQLGTPFPEVQERGYASAFVLMVIVLGISIAARMLSGRFTKHVVK